MSARLLLALGLGLAVGAVGGYLFVASPTQAEGCQVSAWLEVAQRVCNSVGGLGSFASLLFVVGQFHLFAVQNTLMQKNIRAALDAQLYARLESFNRYALEHGADHEMLRRPYTTTRG
jgi:hypothetical protein